MRLLLLIALLVLPTIASASTFTISSSGINSIGMFGPEGELLTGAGVNIGQVEVLRPGDPDVDDLYENSTINPAGVTVEQNAPTSDYLGDGPLTTTDELQHPTWVAGVMLSSDGTYRGVATGASLYADAMVAVGNNEIQALKSTQEVVNAALNVRAINNSWGTEPAGAEGNSQLTLGMDWFASRWDTLMVFAVNGVDAPDFDSPGDNYNGITLGQQNRSAVST